jgi:hypothetical protein
LIEALTSALGSSATALARSRTLLIGSLPRTSCSASTARPQNRPHRRPHHRARRTWRALRRYPSRGRAPSGPIPPMTSPVAVANSFTEPQNTARTPHELLRPLNR